MAHRPRSKSILAPESKKEFASLIGLANLKEAAKEEYHAKSPSRSSLKKSVSDITRAFARPTCDCGPDLYTKILGPTVDEALLETLSMIQNFCGKLSNPCDHAEPSIASLPEKVPTLEKVETVKFSPAVAQNASIPQADPSKKSKISMAGPEPVPPHVSAQDLPPEADVASETPPPLVTPQMVSKILQTVGLSPEMASAIIQTSIASIHEKRPSLRSNFMQTSTPELVSQILQTIGLEPEMTEQIVQTSFPMLVASQTKVPSIKAVEQDGSHHSNEIKKSKSKVKSSVSILTPEEAASRNPSIASEKIAPEPVEDPQSDPEPEPEPEPKVEEPEDQESPHERPKSSIKVPSQVPSKVPSRVPSKVPSAVPSKTPTLVPSKVPSAVPSKAPSLVPSKAPSKVPSRNPSKVPTLADVMGEEETPEPEPEPEPEPAVEELIKSKSSVKTLPRASSVKVEQLPDDAEDDIEKASIRALPPSKVFSNKSVQESAPEPAKKTCRCTKPPEVRVRKSRCRCGERKRMTEETPELDPEVAELIKSKSSVKTLPKTSSLKVEQLPDDVEDDIEKASIRALPPSKVFSNKLVQESASEVAKKTCRCTKPPEVRVRKSRCRCGERKRMTEETPELDPEVAELIKSKSSVKTLPKTSSLKVEQLPDDVEDDIEKASIRALPPSKVFSNKLVQESASEVAKKTCRCTKPPEVRVQKSRCRCSERKRMRCKCRSRSPPTASKSQMGAPIGDSCPTRASLCCCTGHDPTKVYYLYEC